MVFFFKVREKGFPSLFSTPLLQCLINTDTTHLWIRGQQAGEDQERNTKSIPPSAPPPLCVLVGAEKDKERDCAERLFPPFATLCTHKEGPSASVTEAGRNSERDSTPPSRLSAYARRPTHKKETFPPFPHVTFLRLCVRAEAEQKKRLFSLMCKETFSLPRLCVCITR